MSKALEAEIARIRAQYKRDAEIVGRVSQGESMASVARDLGISRQRVEQIVKRARRAGG